MKQKNGSIWPMIQDEQMEVLEHLIMLSQDASDFTKRISIWVLRQTDNLTKEVALSIPNKFYEQIDTQEIQDGVHNMQSAGYSTNIDQIFRLTGTKMRFNHHCGMFVNGQFDVQAKGVTIWYCLGVKFPKDVVLLSPPDKLKDIDSMEFK